MIFLNFSKSFFDFSFGIDANLTASPLLSIFSISSKLYSFFDTFFIQSIISVFDRTFFTPSLALINVLSALLIEVYISNASLQSLSHIFEIDYIYRNYS